jgi:hypothetical protein
MFILNCILFSIVRRLCAIKTTPRFSQIPFFAYVSLFEILRSCFFAVSQVYVIDVTFVYDLFRTEPGIAANCDSFIHSFVLEFYGEFSAAIYDIRLAVALCLVSVLNRSAATILLQHLLESNGASSFE